MEQMMTKVITQEFNKARVDYGPIEPTCTVLKWPTVKPLLHFGPHCFCRLFIMKNINFLVFIVFTIVNNSFVNILILKCL